MDQSKSRREEDSDPMGSSWKAYVYHYLIASMLLAVAAHATVELVPGIRTWVESPLFEQDSASDTHRLRSLIYLILGYISIVPVYLFRFDRLLRASPQPKKGLSDRIFLTVFGAIFLGALVLFPFFFVLTTNVASGRAGLFVASFTDSFFGLVIYGAFLLYAVTFALWLLLRGIPRLWIGQS
ncbi:hypothetical protein [Dyella silvae]|uniref:hypothetical protein n=1 Tax=Dyella silvae TaxID=2994424 RepID=UPI002263F54B|nr:hypothetical protein [Dyella silvae]